jgi:hypothetical protein
VTACDTSADLRRPTRVKPKTARLDEVTFKRLPAGGTEVTLPVNLPD